MGPTGQCNTDLCMAKHSYVCEYKPQGGLCLGRCPLTGTAVEKEGCIPGHHHKMTLAAIFPNQISSPKRRVWVALIFAVNRRETEKQSSEAKHWK